MLCPVHRTVVRNRAVRRDLKPTATQLKASTYGCAPFLSNPAARDRGPFSSLPYATLRVNARSNELRVFNLADWRAQFALPMA